MKTHSLLCSAFGGTVLLATCCFGQSNVVFYGANTNAIAVAFVDVNLSAAAQASIVSDLQLCLQNWGQGSELYLRNKGESVGYLDNSDRNPCYSGNITFPENVVSNGTGGLALQIPRSLSDAYTNAFAFAAANSNIIAAAYAFVAFVSSSNFVSLSSNALPNYLLEKNTTSNEIVADARATLSELRNQTYYPPSILGFQYSETGPAPTNLWMLVPCSSPSGGGYVEWSPFPAIWHDGKWKFCMWTDWVP